MRGVEFSFCVSFVRAGLRGFATANRAQTLNLQPFSIPAHPRAAPKSKTKKIPRVIHDARDKPAQATPLVHKQGQGHRGYNPLVHKRGQRRRGYNPLVHKRGQGHRGYNPLVHKRGQGHRGYNPLVHKRGQGHRGYNPLVHKRGQGGCAPLRGLGRMPQGFNLLTLLSSPHPPQARPAYR